jgi:predicted membrane protein
MSGNVTLVVPRSIAADFEISTFSGNIKNQIGPKPKRTSKYTPGETAEFSTGGGGARITLSSFSGTVKLLTK